MASSTRWYRLSEAASTLKANDWDRLFESQTDLFAQVATDPTVMEFLKSQLAELSADVGATWSAVVRRSPEWKIVAHAGRQPSIPLPTSDLAESLDQTAIGRIQCENSGQFLVAPLSGGVAENAVILVYSRTIADDAVPVLARLIRGWGHAWTLADHAEQARRRIDHLRATLKLASSFSALTETEPLLEEIAREATRLLDCERASIFLWDREHREVIACPALGVAGNSLRLPDKTGVVGEVIHSGRLIRVDDAYADPRFSQQVDHTSGYRTRSLVCGPLCDQEGKITGAFEVLNKRDGNFTKEDEVTLTDLGMQVAAALQNTRERESLLRSHRQLQEQVTRGVTIIGDSPAVVAVRGTIQRLAATDLPVLILGESGTGKEVVAQSLHYQGPRADRPFIAVNCAAIAETLLESELFGHEKGAFTDAHDTRRGKFELAEGGTLFLDEIGDMSLGGQAKLLRVLEQKVITRVGGSQSIPINLRVVAATNARLADMVRAKKFREDLYFRLNVVTLTLPPLRDRPEDVLLLADYFLQQFSAQARRPRLTIAPDAKKRLQAHGWPGNVRELKNLMERVAFLAPGDRVEADDLATIVAPEREGAQDLSPDCGLSEATNVFQQEFIRKAIRRVRGNMTEAATLLGLHRSNLYRKMRQLGMSEAGNEGDEHLSP